MYAKVSEIVVRPIAKAAALAQVPESLLQYKRATQQLGDQKLGTFELT